MSDIITGARIGAFVLFIDAESLRHAVRLGAVLALSDSDACHDSTIMQMPGNRSVLIRASLEEVLAWLR